MMERIGKSEETKVDVMETLFLLSKLLSTVEGFQNTSAMLREELENSSLLGRTCGWNGEERNTKLRDVERLHTNIKPNHISLHLENSLATIRKTSNSGLSSSLLHQYFGVYNAGDASQQARLRELSSSLAELIGRIRAHNERYKRLSHRRARLEHDLLLSGEPLGVEPSVPVSPARRGAVIDVTGDEDVVPILREVGRTHELGRVIGELEAVAAERAASTADMHSLLTAMSRLGTLTSGLERGSVESGLGWLSARSLGLTGPAYRSGTPSLGSGMNPSAALVRSKMSTAYRVQWSVSAHMHNPAYCAVFDHSGQFVLSGSDDYLVKIWHAATGRLLRTCRGHNSYISILALSADNSMFASGCTQGYIRIWRLRDGLCLAVLRHAGAVNWLEFDATSGCLASCGDDGKCLVWDVSKLVPLCAVSSPLLEVVLGEQRYRDALLLNIPERQSEATGSQHCFYGAEAVPSKESTNSCLHDNPRTPVLDVDGVASSTSSSSVCASSAFVVTAESQSSSSSSGSSALFADDSLVTSSSSSANAAVVVPAAVTVPAAAAEAGAGMFKWSRAQVVVEIPNPRRTRPGLLEPAVVPVEVTHLSLPHLQDMFQGDANGEGQQARKVLCLDVSPCGGLLVTGCEDGVARVWRYGDVYTGVHSTRGASRQQESIWQTLEGTCSAEELASFKGVARHLAVRLEGHVSPVTDIHFSALGDRVVSGSAQDGSVRIWSLSRDYSKSSALVLQLAEEDAEPLQSLSSRMRGGKAGGRTKTQVYNVNWTADDLRVVTLQSAPARCGASNPTAFALGTDRLVTRLKLWDSMTGDLLRVISSVSSTPCSVLLCHPLDPHVVLTAGEDGLVNLWNVERECNLCACRLANDSEGRLAHVEDASFSPDGTRIAVTCEKGTVTMLGLDDPARLAGRVLAEQYFSTDYAPFVLDAAGFAIDEGTQLPVHEAPRGQLITAMGHAYADQPAVAHLGGPQPLSKREVRAALEEIIASRQRLAREMERVFAVFSRNKNRGRAPKQYRSATTKPSASYHSPAAGAAGRPRYREFDLNAYQPSSDDSEADSDWERAAPDQEEDRPRRTSSRQRSGRATNGNHNLRSTGGGSLRSNIHTLSSSFVRRSNRSVVRVASDDESDDERPTSSALSRAQRAAQRSANQSRRWRAEHVDDYSGSAADTEEEEDGEVVLLDSDSDGRSSRRSRRATRSGGGGGSRDRPAGATRASGRSAGRARYGVVGSDGEEGALPSSSSSAHATTRKVWAEKHHRASLLAPDADVDREWLQAEAPSDHAYCPQLGDRVVYFPQGHAEVLRAFPEDRSPPWLAFVQRWPFVECEVRALSFRTPTEQEYRHCRSVVASVTLAVVKVPSRHVILPNGLYGVELSAPRSTRHSAHHEHVFVVSLRNCQLPDFLIPHHLFLRSVRLPWHEGTRVTAYYAQVSAEGETTFEPYEGRVARLCNCDAEWPQSPWDALEVEWDSGELGRVAPWDATPSYDAASDYTATLARFKAPHLGVEDAERMAAEIEALVAADEAFGAFQYQVDSTAFPDYYVFTAVAVYTDLLVVRLRSGFYRQLEALEFDVNLLHDNCANYNKRDAEIVRDALRLRDALHRVIRPDHQQAAARSSSSASAAQDNHTVEPTERLTLHLSGKRNRAKAAEEEEEECEFEEESEVLAVLRLKRPRTDDAAAPAAAGIPLNPLPPPHQRITRHQLQTAQPAVSSRERRGRDGGGRNMIANSSNNHNSNTDDSRSIHDLSTGARTTRHSALQQAIVSAVNDAVRPRRDAARGPAPAAQWSLRSAPSTARDRSSRRRDSCLDNDRPSRARNTAVSYREDDEEDGEEQSDEEGESPAKMSLSLRRRPANNQRGAQSSGRRGSHAAEQSSSADSEEEGGSDEEEEEEEVARPTSSRQRSQRVAEAVIEPPVQQSRSGRAVKPPSNYWQQQQLAAETGSSAGSRRKRADSAEMQESSHSQAARISHGVSNSNGHGASSSSGSSGRVDPELRKAMLEVVAAADGLDGEMGLFAQPVDEALAPSYYDIVPQPEDLQSIRERISKRQCHSVEEVVAAVLRMYENCLLYNEPESAYGRQAKRQRKAFEAHLRRSGHIVPAEVV